jgi:hypothetical protein
MPAFAGMTKLLWRSFPRKRESPSNTKLKLIALQAISGAPYLQAEMTAKDGLPRGLGSATHAVTLRIVAGSIEQNNKGGFCDFAQNDKVLILLI